jgi:tripartite-type tricarboxylate transporter receptor subunit TctC
MSIDLSRRGWLTAAGAWAAAGPLRAQAQAQPPVARFPDRPVRLTVPFAVGVGPDVVSRIVGEQLSRGWGQPVLVDNKPGASGIVAFSDVRRATPDGHTLYLADTATMCVNPLIHPSLPYDPAKDLVPLSLLFHATFVILTGGDSRHRGVAQMLDAARREPGRVNYGSLGNGHASQVAIETLARAAGVQLLHIPFKDAGALFTAVAAGDVDFTAFSMNTVAGLVQRGKLRPLAVAARQRLAEHPDIPTLAEAGAPPVDMHPWAGLVAPAGVPEPVLAHLQRDIVAALQAPEVRARIQPLGFELTPSTPQQMRQRIDADLALYAPLVREGRVSRV